MQIHELNNYSGNLDSGAYLAVDDGTDTGKISAQGLLSEVTADIEEEATTRAEADAVLRQAIDDAAIVPAGSTVVVDSTLTISGAAADAKVTGDKFTDLKSNINYIRDDVWESTNIVTTTGTAGARLKYDSGAFSMPSSGLYDVTALVNIEGYKYLSLDYSLIPGSGYNTIVIGYFDSTTMLSANVVGYEEKISYGTSYKIPTGAKYVALTCPSGTHPTITLYSDAIAKIKSEIADIQDGLLESDNISTSTRYGNMRYQVSGGAFSIQSSSLYDILELIPVAEAETFSVDYTLTPADGYGYAPVCFFSSDVLVTANLVDYMTSITANKKYSIPSGTQYIGLFVTTGSTPTATLYKDRLDAIESNVDGLVNEKTRGIFERADSMGASDSISASVGNLKKNTVLGFSANITNFGSLQIGQGKTANAETAYLIIDSSTVKVYSYYNSIAHEEGSYTHGLTIGDYIDVCIEVDNEIGYAKIRITSNGQTYTINRVYWRGFYSAVYADAISGNYTNCLLTYYCADYAKDYWLFGDSYFDHWCPICLEDGYNNFLCDGVSGRKSADAFTSLQRNLAHGKPNTIVWCMGMNNGDTISAVNSSWKEYYDKLVALCTEKGINLILCTIPNVATVNNNYKNAIIRSSGYRYIDLAKAVGSDISTSWYAGLLSNDGVHPSTLGDKMIARFMESAIPEIMK